ncbi:MAG TPA: hypothetical protein VJ302_13795, partial [Blastocatellia bacterium]|nr:hypothetical protein [Blastocatellia bacterium]
MLRKGIQRPVLVECCVTVLACASFLILGPGPVKGQVTIVPGKRGPIKPTSENRKPKVKPRVESKAVSAVRQMPVSKFDTELPSSSLKLWFSKLVGPKASVAWQLTECGETGGQPDGGERDLTACVQANAILADGRQVVVAISVGTFKKGLSGEPAFYSVVIEEDGRLRWIKSLRNLPDLLNASDRLPIRLPELAAKSLQVKPLSAGASISIKSFSWPQMLLALETPPAAPPVTPPVVPEPVVSRAEYTAKLAAFQPLPELQGPQRVQEGVLQGQAMVMVKPSYPVHARSLNASGSVAVQVLVSEDGRVVDAKAVSGPLVL